MCSECFICCAFGASLFAMLFMRLLLRSCMKHLGCQMVTWEPAALLFITLQSHFRVRRPPELSGRRGARPMAWEFKSARAVWAAAMPVVVGPVCWVAALIGPWAFQPSPGHNHNGARSWLEVAAADAEGPVAPSSGVHGAALGEVAAGAAGAAYQHQRPGGVRAACHWSLKVTPALWWAATH